MKTVAAERDRHVSEKVELIAKTSSLLRELDNLRARLVDAVAESDSLRLHLKSAEAERTRLSAEIAKLTQEKDRLLSQEPPAAPDPLVVLTDFAKEKTNALVARARAAIPPDSPALPWFDRTVSGLATAGSVSVKVGGETARWLAPRVKEAWAWTEPRAKELYAKAKSEIEARLATKG